MESLTPGNWQSFFLVLAAILAFVVLASNAVKAIKEWRKPALSVETRLERDHSRLTKLETQQNQMQEESNLILRTQLAMLNHSITGNSVDRLKEMQAEIQKYLINRR